MDNGWIKLHRKMLQWEWYDDLPTCRLFLHLLLVANHKDKNWRGIEIKRGQKLTSLSNLSDETGLTVKQIRLAVEKLKSTGEVASKGTSRYTLFTICNYSDYQLLEGKQEGEQKTNGGQAEGKRRATNKNVKNEKNVKKVSNDTASQKKEFGNDNVNKMLKAIMLKVEVEDFKESQKMQRIWAMNLYRLMEKLSPSEFARRLDLILSDSFKQKNCGSLQFIYKEIKGFVEPNTITSF